jgi:hypothetical protein
VNKICKKSFDLIIKNNKIGGNSDEVGFSKERIKDLGCDKW